MLSGKHEGPVRKLPENATVASVIQTLDKPEDYVRGVLGNMLGHKKQYGDSQVRIGTTGRGIAPHYQVEPAVSIEDPLAGDAFFKEVAFHGRSHEGLPWGVREIKDEHWSTAAMKYAEVLTLLGSLRKPQRGS